MVDVRASGPASLVADAAFILEGRYACHECKSVTPVFALLRQGPFKATGDVYLDEEDDDDTTPPCSAIELRCLSPSPRHSRACPAPPSGTMSA